MIFSLSFKALNKHKFLFIILVLLELSFIISAVFLSSIFIPSAMQAAANASDALSGSIESLSIAPGFTDSYNEMLSLLYKFFIMIALLFIITNALVWQLIYRVIHKKMPWRFGKVLGVLTFWTTVILLTSYYVTSLSPSSVMNYLLALNLLVFFYFMYIALALVPATQTFKKSFVIGATRAKLLPVYLSNTLIIAVCIWLSWKVHAFVLLLAVVLILTKTRFVIATWNYSKKSVS